ncbi:MAG: YHS domain-containing protein [Deltaproteobacteria bacterium]|nr:YHS domain-containing protein [Deltaproteobacteria bacterium]
MRRLSVAFPYLFFGALALLVVWTNWSAMNPAMAMRSETMDGMEGMKGHGNAMGGMAGAVTDPVCRMQVNPQWGFSETYQGTTFHFCTERCRKLFREDPERYVLERCMVCEAPIDESTALPSTYLGKTYRLCSEEHRQAFQADPARYFMHTMWGIPPWMYYVSIAALLLVSFAWFEGRPARPKRSPRPGPEPGSDRVDLMRFGVIRRAVRSRPFRAACQMALVAAFALILVAGLFPPSTSRPS